MTGGKGKRLGCVAIQHNQPRTRQPGAPHSALRHGACAHDTTAKACDTARVSATTLLGYGQNIQSDWNINAAEFKNFYPLTHQGSHAFHKKTEGRVNETYLL